MRKKLSSAAAITAVAAFGFVPAGASAAHCGEPGSPTPGYSYFGTDHVQESTHAEGGNPAPHMDNPGASNCRSTDAANGTGPSDRAPGKR